MVVREGSRDVRVTKKRAIVKKLVAAAIEGDVKAASMLMSLCAKLPRGPEEDPRAAEDEEFVKKLAAREPQTSEETGTVISSPNS